MNRFRKPSLVALMLLLILAMSTASAFAYGRLPGRGIESGGDENPEQTLVGDPDWGGGGRPNTRLELDLHVRIVLLIAVRAVGLEGVYLVRASDSSARSTGEGAK